MRSESYPLALTILSVIMLGFPMGCSRKSSDANRPMSPGEKLYRANCAACHRLLAPEEHDAPTWEAYIEKYGKRLSAEEKKLVYNFLTGQEASTEANEPSDI